MGEERNVKYFLDIQWPSRRDKTLAQFSALTPFQAVHTGDYLHSQSMVSNGDSIGWLRVVGVVHRIWDLTEHISHLTTVYTVAVTAEEALSFGGTHVAAEPAPLADDIALEATPVEVYDLEAVSDEELKPNDQ